MRLWCHVHRPHGSGSPAFWLRVLCLSGSKLVRYCMGAQGTAIPFREIACPSPRRRRKGRASAPAFVAGFLGDYCWRDVHRPRLRSACAAAAGRSDDLLVGRRYRLLCWCRVVRVRCVRCALAGPVLTCRRCLSGLLVHRFACLAVIGWDVLGFGLWTAVSARLRTWPKQLDAISSTHCVFTVWFALVAVVILYLRILTRHAAGAAADG